MPKIKIKVSLLHNEEKLVLETNAIIQENIIKYKENKETVVILDKNSNKLTRENNEIYMNYLFDISKKTQGTLLVKELNRKLSLEIETKKIIKKENYIEIIFKVEDEYFQYYLEEVKWVF